MVKLVVAEDGSDLANEVWVAAGLKVARQAGRLAEEHALRGYDAVHLATALSAADDGLLVVTWDRDLAVAALRCGRAVAPVLAQG